MKSAAYGVVILLALSSASLLGGAPPCAGQRENQGNNGFFRRALSLSNTAPLRLKNLAFGPTTFSAPARETVRYVTSIAAPTVEFIRHDQGGLFTGIENPYFQADLSEQGVALSFEPALILKPGEGYASEPQFMGVYRKSGVMLEDSGRDFRYNANLGFQGMSGSG